MYYTHYTYTNIQSREKKTLALKAHRSFISKKVLGCFFIDGSYELLLEARHFNNL
jgi:hypothetical protein